MTSVTKQKQKKWKNRDVTTRNVKSTRWMIWSNVVDVAQFFTTKYVCLETYENEKRLKQNIRGSNLCYTCFLALESDQKHQDDEIHKDDEQTETVVETKTPTLPTIPTNLGLTGSFQPPSCIGVSMLRSFTGSQTIAGTVVAEEYKEPTPPIPPMLL